jgi:hypothetical protein
MATAHSPAHAAHLHMGFRPLEERAFMRAGAVVAQSSEEMSSIRRSTASTSVAQEQTNLTEPSSKR